MNTQKSRIGKQNPIYFNIDEYRGDDRLFVGKKDMPYNSALNESDAVKIVEMRCEGLSPADLATLYKVSVDTIGSIIRGQKFASVTYEARLKLPKKLHHGNKHKISAEWYHQ